MNQMKTIRIEKLTLNVGAGKDTGRLEKSMKLLKMITGVEPVKTYTNKRIPTWNLRPGLPIGCKITIRGKKAITILKTLLTAKDNVLKDKQFDNNGNLAFGIHEYIDIKDIQYNPEIGITGFEVCITFERPGYRVKKRKIQTKKVGKAHRISREEAKEFIKKEFDVTFGDE